MNSIETKNKKAVTVAPRPVSTYEPLYDFVLALVRKDSTMLESLLHDQGKFEMQDAKLNTRKVKKKKFIQWIEEQWVFEKIKHIDYDQCLYCHLGHQVVLLNKGQFPRKIKDSSERSKTGLRVSSENGKIKEIQFCYVFLKTENKYQFECNMEMKFGKLKKQ